MTSRVPQMVLDLPFDRSLTVMGLPPNAPNDDEEDEADEQDEPEKEGRASGRKRTG
jgi:hypothetical protein